MQYRVFFSLFRDKYYTEWFETLDEAAEFVRNADNSGGALAHWVEDEDGEVI